MRRESPNTLAQDKIAIQRFFSSTMERAKPAVARTSTGGKPTEMGVRYLSKNYAIELSHLQAR
jgi:hypothetical protein